MKSASATNAPSKQKSKRSKSLSLGNSNEAVTRNIKLQYLFILDEYEKVLEKKKLREKQREQIVEDFALVIRHLTLLAGGESNFTGLDRAILLQMQRILHTLIGQRENRVEGE